MSKPFVIMYFTGFLVAMNGTFITLNFKMYFLTKINDDSYLTFVASFNLLISSLSNAIWGPIADKYPFKYIYSLAM